ncbi:hypothetical protein HDE_06160 [Halotydeus destructor]|nr:hypothetical protein HDE_06160 [Halotydeus destructor]
MIGEDGAKTQSDFKGYNHICYTVRTVDSSSSGYADQYGNYSGLVGILQRKEADFAVHMVLLGGLKGEPVKHDIIRTAADLHIYSSKGVVDSRHTDLLDAIDAFDLTTLSYFLALLHLVCAILAFAVTLPSLRWLWSTYRKGFWKCFGLMVDQEDYKLKPWSSRLLWLHLSAAIFVAVVGYFLSLVSADSIAEIPPRLIERYDDIFSSHFNRTLFHIFSNFFFYDYLKQSPPGSKLAKLTSKLESDSKGCKVWYECAIANFGDGSYQDLTTFLQRCSRGRSALMFTRQGVDHGGAILACRMVPDLMVAMHRSREKVATGSLTTFHRHGLDDRVERYVRNRMHRYIDTGLHLAVFGQLMEGIADETMGPRISSYDKCRDGYVERPDHAIFATMGSLRKTFISCATSLALSVLSIFLEYVSRTIARRRKSKSPNFRALFIRKTDVCGEAHQGAIKLQAL